MDEPTIKESGTSQQLCLLYAALAKAQGEFQPILKNRSVKISMKTGGSYNFRYADLEEITAKTRPALAKNGLATIQPIIQRGNGTVLLTKLVHADGGEIVSEISLPPSSGGDIKNYGAQISYLRRYAKTSILDVAADDDLDENGQEAEEPQQTKRAEKAEQAPEFYSQELFEANLPAWTDLILSGKKTPNAIVMTVGSRNPLTEQQRKTILAINEESQ